MDLAGLIMVWFWLAMVWPRAGFALGLSGRGLG